LTIFASPQEIRLFLASLLLRIIKRARVRRPRGGRECEHLKRTEEGDEKSAKPKSALDVTMRKRRVAQIYMQSRSVRYTFMRAQHLSEKRGARTLCSLECTV
jgi:hypothetical protein